MKIEDGEVYVVSTDPARSDLDARDILEVSSYGGIYKESGFYVQEEENGAGSSTQEEKVKAGTMTGDGQEGHGYYEELIAVAGECAIKKWRKTGRLRLQRYAVYGKTLGLRNTGIPDQRY